MPLFRVHFSGPWLDDPETLADASGAAWEGMRGSPRGTRYYFLVNADTSFEAMGAVRDAVAHLADYREFAAAVVTPPPGWRGLGPHEETIDWVDVATRCELSELQQAALDSLLDSTEPTWIILKDPDTDRDREAVEAALHDLEQRGLVAHTREVSGHPGSTLTDLDDWWWITDQGWEVIGLIKRPWYGG